MKSQLRILHLEDDPSDAELVQEMLASEGIVCKVMRIETEVDFVEALQQGTLDLILADYTLPSFDGISALRIVRQGWPDIPFIFVSGTLGEEIAIEALKIGATDYVFKTRLSRLVPSVQRALREAKQRTERKVAEEELRRSEAYLAEAQRLTNSGSWAYNVRTLETFWSQEMFRILGYDRTTTKPSVSHFLERVHPEDRAKIEQRAETESSSADWVDPGIDYRIVLPDGTIKRIHSIAHRTVGESGEIVEVVGTT